MKCKIIKVDNEKGIYSILFSLYGRCSFFQEENIPDKYHAKNIPMKWYEKFLQIQIVGIRIPIKLQINMKGSSQV